MVFVWKYSAYENDNVSVIPWMINRSKRFICLQFELQFLYEKGYINKVLLTY